MSNALPTTTFRFIFHFVKKQWIKFTFLLLTSTIWGMNEAIFPYFIKRIVNTLQNYQGDPQHIFSALSGTLAFLVAFWVVTDILLRTQGFVQVYAFPQFRTHIRDAVFRYVQSHSHNYFASHFAGNLAKKLADLPSSSQMIMEIICFQFITAIVGAAIVTITMWQTNTFFAGILILWLIIHFGLVFLFMHKGNILWEQHSDAVSVLSGKIVDAFTNMLNVRLFARAHYEANYLKSYQQDEMKKAEKAMWLTEVMRIGLGLNGLFLIFGMVFTLIYGWSHGWVTLGDVAQVSMQSFWILGWMWFVSFQLTVFAREAGTVSDALSLVKKSHDLVDKKNAPPILIQQGKIQFDHVSFSYQQHKVIFNHLNLVIPAGQKVGLVGFSGSGKSTFVNLILRFYDVTAGRILIDDQNIAEVTQDSLRAQIAMIPQDPALFHRSLLENIRYGYLDASDEEVIKASKLAHCHEFIATLDEGYHALVGERGIKLSGGQRQRIAIARAILKNAPILILDEATSSLDSITEKLIQESLYYLMKNRTTIVIAHRLSTLADMDRILVFHQSKIIEEGDQESLLKANGHFAMLWNMQTDGFLPDK